jgi:hypothetical protein
MMMATSRSASWAEHICHPVSLAAVVVLAVNDHLLKGSGLLDGAITGKLSDVAGLFFFPLLISAAVRGVRGAVVDDERDHPAIALSAITATGLTFTALKTLPPFNEVVSAVLGPNVLDPTDLWALLALLPSWLWMRRRTTPRLSHRLHLAAVAVSGLASLATSGPRGHYVRNFPMWTIEGPHTRAVRCGSLDAWVLKSGKQGAGIVLEVTANTSDCRVDVQAVRLVLKSETVSMATQPLPALVEAGAAPKDVYLPLLFDGDAAWNRGDHDASLHVALVVGGKPEAWDLHLIEKFEGGPYVFRYAEPRGRPLPARVEGKP